MNIVAQFNEFLKQKNDASIEHLQQLRTNSGITLVLTNQDDPEGCGTFVQYRAAWDVAGKRDALANFFALVDDGGYRNSLATKPSKTALEQLICF